MTAIGKSQDKSWDDESGRLWECGIIRSSVSVCQRRGGHRYEAVGLNLKSEQIFIFSYFSRIPIPHPGQTTLSAVHDRDDGYRVLPLRCTELTDLIFSNCLMTHHQGAAERTRRTAPSVPFHMRELAGAHDWLSIATWQGRESVRPASNPESTGTFCSL